LLVRFGEENVNTELGIGTGTGTAATGMESRFSAMGAGLSLTEAGRDQDKCLRE